MDKRLIAVAAVIVVALAAAGAYAVFSGDGSGSGTIVGKQLKENEFPSKDSRLWVYGNANEDDKLDTDDVTYLQSVVDGTKDSTTLCDANADGRIDGEDLDYLRTIIAAIGTENALDVFYVDNYFKVAKVSWPVKSVAIGYCSGAYVADVTGVAGKVKMVDETIHEYWKEMYPTYATAASYGDTSAPNYEAMMKERIDVYVPGYADSAADPLSPGKLNPAGIDVMFMSTADNSGVDYPNEHIDRSILMFGFLLQGNVAKTYEYLEWHDGILGKLKAAAATIPEDEKSHFIMARSSFAYTEGTISITGKDNTNNIHATWVGVDAVGQHDPALPKNYNSLTQEQLLAVIDGYRGGTVYYMDNEHFGIRQQRDLDDCIAANEKMLREATATVHHLTMAREAGNSPMYIVELAFYQNVMYPELESGVDWTEVFNQYFQMFASFDYWSTGDGHTVKFDIDQFFFDVGIPS